MSENAVNALAAALAEAYRAAARRHKAAGEKREPTERAKTSSQTDYSIHAPPMEPPPSAEKNAGCTRSYLATTTT